jgi:hypothetical protein
LSVALLEYGVRLHCSWYRRKQARERAEAGDFVNLAAQSREMLNA